MVTVALALAVLALIPITVADTCLTAQSAGLHTNPCSAPGLASVTYNVPHSCGSGGGGGNRTTTSGRCGLIVDAHGWQMDPERWKTRATRCVRWANCTATS